MTNSRIGKQTPAFEEIQELCITHGGWHKFTVSDYGGWDLGDPMGDGMTVREAVMDFQEVCEMRGKRVKAIINEFVKF